MPSIGSSLPEDSCVFQRDRNALAAPYHSRLVVCWGAGSRHSRVVNVAARPAARRERTASPAALEFHAFELHQRRTGLEPRIGVEIVEIDFNLKNVPLRGEWQPSVLRRTSHLFLFQTVLPIDYLAADCAFIGTAQMVGGRGREVVLLGIFAHRAVGGEARCQPRHAFPHPRHPGRGNALLVAGMKPGSPPVRAARRERRLQQRPKRDRRHAPDHPPMPHPT